MRGMRLLLPLKGGLNLSLSSTQVAKTRASTASTVVGEYGTSAQSSKSTQAVNKLQAKQNAEIANILAGSCLSTE